MLVSAHHVISSSSTFRELVRILLNFISEMLTRWKIITAVAALGALASIGIWAWTGEPDLAGPGEAFEPITQRSSPDRHASPDIIDDPRAGPGPFEAPGPERGENVRRLSPQEIEAAVRSFKETTRPLSERAANVRSLAAAGDADSVSVLTKLGDEGCYLSWVAVEALGSVNRSSRRDAIIEYLKGKLSDDDPRVVEAAIRAYGRLAGEEAVSSIAAAIRGNRSRADGYGEIVNAVAARTLGAIGSKAAVPILASELSRARNSGAWDYEYGSQLVAALGRIESVEARRAIGTYAAWISSHLPQDPMARSYMERKIEEARRAAPGETAR